MQKIVKLPLRAFYSLAGKVFRQDDRIALRLYDYFPSYRSAFGELMNQAFRIFRQSQAYAIQGVVIEPTNICNLKCGHCTPQRIPGSKRGYMAMDLFKSVIDDNPQITCLILTKNGEPFMHPGIFDMIRHARDKNIYVTVFTNGTLLNSALIDKILASGLSEINFSMEGTGELYERNRGKPYSAIEASINALVAERKKRRSSLKIAINSALLENQNGARDVKDKWSAIVDFITVEPLMGGKSRPRRSPCRTLWRNVAIAWNGDVVPCCADMGNRLIIGNVRNKPLKEIYNGREAKKLRIRHLTGDYPATCKYCGPYFG